MTNETSIRPGEVIPVRPATFGQAAEEAAGLARLSAGARSWMDHNLDYLDPSFSDLPVTPKVKASLELALLSRLWTRFRPDDEELGRLTAAVHRIWENPDFPRQLSAAPNYFRQYGLIYGALAPPGAACGFHKAILEQLAPGGYLAPYGKSPYLRLETRYYADLAGLDHQFESYQELYAASFVANLDAVRLPMDIEEAYDITHTIFHITDFGARDPGLAPDERERVLDIADQLTGHFVEIEYWDLIAEFLLARHCLGEDPTRTRSGAAAVHALLDAQTPSGAIPGRFAAQRPPATAPPLELFRKSFHTTLVTAIAAMAILPARRA